ncbi:MAG TPA: hypothetical protein VIP57_17955, partial [Candidatus Dormibacteraeota bacterium]
MNEDEDLELQALQRQLDDAFQTTRPRPKFEAELWSRMQARRPIWPRVGAGLAGLVRGIGSSSSARSAAVAVALVVLLGAGIYRLGGIPHGGGGGASTAAGPISNDTGSAVALTWRLPAQTSVAAPPYAATPFDPDESSTGAGRGSSPKLVL